MLPESWQGTHVEFYTEGVYSVATFYLNGQLLGTHSVSGGVVRSRCCSSLGSLSLSRRPPAAAPAPPPAPPPPPSASVALAPQASYSKSPALDH